ncbi:MAG: hypothetical protein M1833_000389 [Piccolia ochrophora]|nr:MAG: hypothetical protein M1833_000389 [Piccolia ochrophora]
MTDRPPTIRVALIGSGTIGLSFAALHLAHATVSHPVEVTIHDPRPDLDDYIARTLPGYLHESPTAGPLQRLTVESLLSSGQLRVSATLEDAVREANIVQEQGPERLDFKSMLWATVEQHAPADTLFWSSTSGIPASRQSERMRSPGRLLVVHPYNPPHLMPLLEIVPSPQTPSESLRRTVEYWKRLGRAPVTLHRECTGFVANRLAFALLRESIHLVDRGVVSMKDLDTIVESSMGPRWAVSGPFRSYHLGGGAGGLEAFFQNIGGTVQECWEDAGQLDVGGRWEAALFREAHQIYGEVREGDFAARDQVTRRVLAARDDEGHDHGTRARRLEGRHD